MTDFTEEFFFQMTLKEIVFHYPQEIKWFADEDLRMATPEIAKSESIDSWTKLLADNNVIKQISGKKYIELERMLSSLVFYQLFKAGTDSAWQFYNVQQAKNQTLGNVLLKKESFLQLHNIFNQLITDNPRNDKAIDAMLVYSDLGKTNKAFEIAKVVLADTVLPEDHDDYIEFVLQQENVNEIIPSINRIELNTLKILQDLAATMKVHWGHLKHWEGSMEQVLGKFIKAVQNIRISRNDILMTFAIQMCDVAASAAHGLMFSSALTEDFFQFYYHKPLKLLLDIFDNQAVNPEEDFRAYLEDITSSLGLSLDEPREYLAARLSTMLRYTQSEQAEAILYAINELAPENQELLIQQLGPNGQINTWLRNPSYFNSVMINLAGKEQELSQKAKRIVEGAVCLSKLAVKMHDEVVNSKTPCCFVDVARRASAEPDKLMIDNFNVEEWELNGTNVNFKQLSSQLVCS